MRRETTASICGTILGVSAFLFILTASLHWASFDMSYYERAFIRYEIAEDLQIELSELMGFSHRLADYLRGELDSPNVYATVRGTDGPLYGEREMLHLVDVRELFDLSYTIKRASALVSALLLSVIVYYKLSRQASRGYLWAFGGISCLLMLLGVLAALDFNRYFTYFHLISFSNDLWILDPATENLIRMFPEPFFGGIAARTAIVSAVVYSSTALAARRWRIRSTNL